MIRKIKVFGWILVRLLAFLLLSIQADCKISLRTSIDEKELSAAQKIYVAVGFEVPAGEHVTAPVGNGRSLAPNISWKNAKVLNVTWPKAIDIPEPDGGKSEYSGYTKNFEIIYALSVDDKSKPIGYELFYVVCGNMCKPVQESGTLPLNGLLKKDELEKLSGQDQSTRTIFPFALMLLFGVLGGIILNFMPCVFPIISMKIFGLLKSSTSENIPSTRSIKIHGLLFSAGTITTFLALGSVLLILRQSVADIGWGFYMQEPKFVTCILLAFLLCSLNFFGIYNLALPGIPTVKLPIKGEFIKSFFGGVFGAVVSAACVGPFAGISIASALLYGNFFQSECIFAALGMGVALPFLAISISPGLVKRFPKPGAWMEAAKGFMGFVMLFSCVWFLWILSAEIGITSVMKILFILISLALFVWILGKSSKSKIMMAVALAGAVISSYSAIYFSKVEDKHDEIKWQNYSDEIFDNFQKQKKPIFLNFTAAWCLNCQFNHRVFEDKDIIAAFDRHSVLPLKCDWTNRNEAVTRLLQKFGTTSVPFYVYYPDGQSEPKVLPVILTKESVIDVLNSVKK